MTKSVLNNRGTCQHCKLTGLRIRDSPGLLSFIRTSMINASTGERSLASELAGLLKMCPWRLFSKAYGPLS